MLATLELLELAWHDCYGETNPPVGIIDDIFLCSAGELSKLATTAVLAVTDWRDVRVMADQIRLSAKSLEGGTG